MFGTATLHLGFQSSMSFKMNDASVVLVREN
jgi:hypothetical protein